MRIIHPDDRARVVAADLRSAAEGQPHNTDYRIILPSGDVRWIASRGNLQYDATGKAARAVGVCFDITSRKEAETRLADEGRSLRLGQSLLASASARSITGTGQLILDDTAAHLFNLPAQRWLPRPSLRDRLHPADRAEVEAALNASLAPDGDGRLAVEARIPLADGRTRWIAAQQQIEFATAKMACGPREAPSSWCATSPNVVARGAHRLPNARGEPPLEEHAGARAGDGAPDVCGGAGQFLRALLGAHPGARRQP